MRRQSLIWLVVVAVVGAGWSVPVRAEVEFIQESTPQTLPVITFDNNINPISPANPFGSGLSEDALNILRAHAVALQQVQAAINYLRANRMTILEGNNTFYNRIFGDFYVKGNQFDGSYEKRSQNKWKSQKYIKTSNGLYSRTLVRQKTQNILVLQNVPVIVSGFEVGRYGATQPNGSIAYGPQRFRLTPNQETLFLSVRPTTQWYPDTRPELVPVADPQFDIFNSPIEEEVYNTAHFDRILAMFEAIEAAMSEETHYSWGAQTTDDPNNPGTNLMDPSLNTYATANGQTIGDPLYGAGTMTLDPSQDRGYRQWGYSTSFSDDHIDQLENDPNNPLLWYLDNSLTGNPDIDLTFFRERLDAYGSQTTTTDANGNTVNVNDIFLGQGFLKEKRRSGGLNDTQPNSRSEKTQLRQYQMLISAFATMLGNEPGLSELFGDTPFFLGSMDSDAFARFVDLAFSPRRGGLGDGTGMVPFGKRGTYSDTFNPIIISE